ncbi:MAG: hypothetical protein JW751_04615 [Polyangiaceae bacterium]|nr:hypothetical protein [Polyangiaceae bacterium]
MRSAAPRRSWSLRRWALRLPIVRRSVLEPIDTGIFRERPRGRVAWGLFLVSVASLMGVPTATVLAVTGAWLGAPGLAAVGAPVLYAVSIPLFGGGLYLSGRAAMEFASVILRLGTRALVRPFLHGVDPAALARAASEPRDAEGKTRPMP